MFEAVIVTSIITIIVLKFFLNINFKKMKEMKIGSLESLKKVSNKFPTDEEICKGILKKLNNENVKVKIKPEYNSCVYTVYNHTITIGKFEQNYMKIQTIAHECIHACQNKRILWSNFIFTNIYLIYFIVILIASFFNKLPYTNIYMIVLLFLSVIQYSIRFGLENEAMVKALYVAKEYIEDNKILTTEEKRNLLNEYDNVNKVGIPFINYYLISMNIVKVILYAFTCLV